MDDKQYRRIRRFFAVAIILIGIVVILMVILINKPRDVNNFYYTGKTGASGQDGYTPKKGIDYRDGVDSISTNTVVEKQITEVVNVIEQIPIKGEKGDTGEKGDKGDKGDSGDPILFDIDYNTCKLKTKYESDDNWQTIAQLPTPCEVSDGN